MSNNKEIKENKPIAIDLFSGAGGLSMGLSQAGFEVAVAIDNFRPATETYRFNHPNTYVICDDIKNVEGYKLSNLSPTGQIDLVAGCPPCQGFSSLTSKYKREDPRNVLVLEMLRIILETDPRIVMMENVPGLATKGKPIFDKFLKELQAKGYIVNYDILQVADYGIPQTRRRLVLLAGKGFEVNIPPQTHSSSGRNGKKKWKTVRETIKGLGKPVVLDDAKLSGGPRGYNWNVIRKISEKNKLRLRSLAAGESRARLPQELRPDCHKGLDHGFSNVYGRLEWDKPSATITAGCTTLSKGRFGHPEEERPLSLREAALLQTFPEDYEFVTDYMDIACTLVGNALPCEFARILAAQCFNSLSEQEKKHTR